MMARKPKLVFEFALLLGKSNFFMQHFYKIFLWWMLKIAFGYRWNANICAKLIIANNDIVMLET